jgi:hypothetical protein
MNNVILRFSARAGNGKSRSSSLRILIYTGLCCKVDLLRPRSGLIDSSPAL